MRHDLHHLGLVRIRRHADDGEAFGLQLLMEPLERRHLFEAGRTPTCPQIDEHHLAGKAGERKLAAADARHLEGRRGIADLEAVAFPMLQPHEGVGAGTQQGEHDD